MSSAWIQRKAPSCTEGGAIAFQYLSATSGMNGVAEPPEALSTRQKALDWNPHPSDDRTLVERKSQC
jgi:hypothetical protein